MSLASLLPQHSKLIESSGVADGRRYRSAKRKSEHAALGSRTFERDSVDVDAIPPAALPTLACHCIEQHVDQDERRVLTVEAEERWVLERIAGEAPE